MNIYIYIYISNNFHTLLQKHSVLQYPLIFIHTHIYMFLSGSQDALPLTDAC